MHVAARPLHPALRATFSRKGRRGSHRNLLHEMSRRHLPEPPRRAPVIDSANGARRFLVRNAPPEGAARRVGARRRRNQVLGVGRLRVFDDRGARADLDDLAEVHHRDAWLMRSTTAMSCEMNRKASPISACRRIIRLTTRALTETSSGETASSATISFGPSARALAMATL